MQNESRKRFINKIKIISNVLKKEIEDGEILTPNEAEFIKEIAEKFDFIHLKMTGN